LQLVVNTFGTSVRRRGERFQIATAEKSVEFSAHKISSLLITTGAILSTDAILLASQHQIDIVCLDPHGDPYGRVWLPRLGAATEVRRRQLALSETAAGFDLSRGWVVAKLRNQEEFLGELRSRRPGQDALFAPPGGDRPVPRRD
jgi:CRISPR-associated protein Cas1